jgi:hypothetical protein
VSVVVAPRPSVIIVMMILETTRQGTSPSSVGDATWFLMADWTDYALCLGSFLIPLSPAISATS